MSRATGGKKYWEKRRRKREKGGRKEIMGRRSGERWLEVGSRRVREVLKKDEWPRGARRME